jgi:hypothetical protein
VTWTEAGLSGEGPVLGGQGTSSAAGLRFPAVNPGVSAARVRLPVHAVGPPRPLTDAQAGSARDGLGDGDLARFGSELLRDEIAHGQHDVLEGDRTERPPSRS